MKIAHLPKREKYMEMYGGERVGRTYALSKN